MTLCFIYLLMDVDGFVNFMSTINQTHDKLKFQTFIAQKRIWKHVTPRTKTLN